MMCSEKLVAICTGIPWGDPERDKKHAVNVKEIRRTPGIGNKLGGRYAPTVSAMGRVKDLEEKSQVEGGQTHKGETKRHGPAKGSTPRTCEGGTIPRRGKKPAGGVNGGGSGKGMAVELRDQRACPHALW